MLYMLWLFVCVVFMRPMCNWFCKLIGEKRYKLSLRRSVCVYLARLCVCACAFALEWAAIGNKYVNRACGEIFFRSFGQRASAGCDGSRPVSIDRFVVIIIRRRRGVRIVPVD